MVSHNAPVTDGQMAGRTNDYDAKNAVQRSYSTSKTVTYHTVLTVHKLSWRNDNNKRVRRKNKTLWIAYSILTAFTQVHHNF